ncbi:indole-3-glycerol phosphate synthase TrpC [Serpentinicella alkaliphila]|uniref:indole-3-glycerol-phosphate synthase n=1 Tax=Serpentinicella alkaliphila TaxID=1734049 RepID=A0A4V2T511_9FIRM|nr:indole-3-glycerol phosphate synthase TrpC [Serpentinicella alkaliphila]QUH25301.1 indole-3-glycerol-phosphate synthase [Serpentinicella alkaliphila]TCQ07114.1 indole-3-glycerol phosphate synthase [Serpentinicella alkaliphila]
MFIVDPYQIYESKYLGASCILLIASILDENKLRHFNSLAYSLGLDTIIEVHNRDEIAKALYARARIIGINNRNLKDFSLNINRTLELRKYIPNNILVVSESGISNSKDVQVLRKTNIDAILVGEGFMKATNIKDKAKELIEAYGT